MICAFWPRPPGRVAAVTTVSPKTADRRVGPGRELRLQISSPVSTSKRVERAVERRGEHDVVGDRRRPVGRRRQLVVPPDLAGRLVDGDEVARALAGRHANETAASALAGRVVGGQVVDRGEHGLAVRTRAVTRCHPGRPARSSRELAASRSRPSGRRGCRCRGRCGRRPGASRSACRSARRPRPGCRPCRRRSRSACRSRCEMIGEFCMSQS